jgi:murein hydrolase activator
MLERRAQSIAGDIRRLRGLREDILMQDRRYSEANARLQTARSTIGGLIAERRMLEARLRRDAQTERARIAEIANRSRDLRDLIARLGKSLPEVGAAGDEMPEAPAFASGFPGARGALPFPVAGQVTTRFGARLNEGGEATGITIRSRASAQVISPYDGRVEFSGPFRTYGRVLIVNVGSGHHIVLAGLGATFAEAGQEVLAGEPVGEMSDDVRLVPDLYMEVRQDGAPRDPAVWLRRQEDTSKS